MSSCDNSLSHDALDRQNRLTFADGRSRNWTFDRDSNITVYTDENGSVSNRTYDALNRLKDDTITRAVGVIGSTLQTFQYDGAGRNTRATDNGDPADPAQSSVVTNVYDSLGRLLEESLQIGSTCTVRYTTGSKWSSDSDRTELTYPNARKVQSTHDELGRLKTLKDDGAAAPFATWRWMGSERAIEVAYASGVCLTHLNDARTRSANQPGYPAEIRGYDGVQRITAHRWLECTLDTSTFATGYVNPGTPLIGFRHAWNAADNKLSQELMHATGDSEGYKYDSAYRLIKFERGTLNAALTEIVTLTATPGLLQRQTFTLDGPGDWPTNVTTTGGTPTTETRTHNNLNQITAINGVPLTYDSNGNTTDDRDNLHAYDAKNRLRRVTRKSDNVVVGTYSYDALGRRIRRVYIVGADPAKTVHYYLDGQRVIEEREPSGGSEPLARQYTYGPYIDECLTLDRDLNANGSATDAIERLFYHANTLYSVFGLSDSNRNFAERYLYDAYGRPILWLPGPDGTYGTGDDVRTANGSSTVQNVRLFTGRESDGETRLYYLRARYQSPVLGRFISRDPMHDVDGPNLFVYARNRSTALIDPTGSSAACAVGFQAPAPGKRPAGTTCNPNTGLPVTGFDITAPYWAKKCFSFPEVGKCVQADENEHWGNIFKTGCCKQLKKCLDNAVNYAEEKQCQDAYNSWVAFNGDAFECCATRKGAQCFSKLASDDTRSKECRCKYLEEAERLREVNSGACSAARQKLGFPTFFAMYVSPCPFDETTGKPKSNEQIQKDEKSGPFIKICDDWGWPVSHQKTCKDILEGDDF